VSHSSDPVEAPSVKAEQTLDTIDELRLPDTSMSFPSDHLKAAEELAYSLVNRMGALKNSETNPLSSTRIQNIMKLVRKLEQEVEREEAQSTVFKEESYRLSHRRRYSQEQQKSFR
jgi:hypothetical protein